MIKQFLISVYLFSSLSLFASHRPSLEHMQRQDSYDYADDIKIWCLEQIKIDGLQIPEATLYSIVSTIIEDGLLFATQQGATNEDDDGIILYSRETVFTYINQKLKQYEAVADTNISGDSKNILQLPCSHRYHEPCILRWLQSASSCPQCRRECTKDQLRLCTLPKASDPQTATDSDATPRCGACLEDLIPPEQAAPPVYPISPSSLSTMVQQRQKPRGINQGVRTIKSQRKPVWRP